LSTRYLNESIYVPEYRTKDGEWYQLNEECSTEKYARQCIAETEIDYAKQLFRIVKVSYLHEVISTYTKD